MCAAEEKARARERDSSRTFRHNDRRRGARHDYEKCSAKCHARAEDSSFVIRHWSFHTGAMLDIRLLREKPDFVLERLATRGGEEAARIDDLLKVDAERRKTETELQRLQSERNRLSKEIGAKKSKGEATKDLEAEVRKIGEQIVDLHGCVFGATTFCTSALKRGSPRSDSRSGSTLIVPMFAPSRSSKLRSSQRMASSLLPRLRCKTARA